MARKARHTESRDATDRQSDERQMPQAGYRGLLALPDTARAPEGMTYFWVRRTLNNEEDRNNSTAKAMEGWKPVPASRHPELSTSGLFGEVSMGYIERKGLVLCECPTELVDARREALRRDQYEEMYGVEWAAQGTVAGAPTFDESTMSAPPRGGRAFKE